MQAIELDTVIDENGEIRLRLPAVLKARKARVIVLYDETAEAATEAGEGDLRHFLQGLNQGDWPARSKADIDEQVRKERDGWAR
jgi:hypothetical protein